MPQNTSSEVTERLHKILKTYHSTLKLITLKVNLPIKDENVQKFRLGRQAGSIFHMAGSKSRLPSKEDFMRDARLK